MVLIGFYLSNICDPKKTVYFAGVTKICNYILRSPKKRILICAGDTVNQRDAERRHNYLYIHCQVALLA